MAETYGNADPWRAEIPRSFRGSNLDCMVVAIFQGKSTNSTGVRCVEIEHGEENTILRFDELSYQTMGGFDKTQPFGFFVLPRRGKPVVLEEDVNGIINQPPKWKRRATL